MDKKIEKLLQSAQKTKKANLRGFSPQDIPKELWEISDLTELDLSRCGLTRVPSEVASLKNLVQLNLKENPLDDIPDFLTELPLESLRFDSKRIRTFPEFVFEMSTIKEFSCSQGLLNGFPRQITNWKKLSLLDLRGNSIETLPEEFYQLKELKILVFLDCGLKQIGPEISKLKKLKSLGLQKNRLHTVPDEVFELPKLENLYLSDNQISTLRREHWSLPKLKNLNLNNNPLKDIPDAIESCSNLQLLLAADCQLATLPKTLLKFTKLERLKLSGNPLPLPDSLKQMGDEYPQLLNTQGLLKHLASYGNEHPVWGGDWPADQVLQKEEGVSVADVLFGQYNEVGISLTEESKELGQIARGALENFLLQEFRLQLTSSGFQKFVEDYGWSEELRERLKDGLLKVGAVRFWRFVKELERAAPSAEQVNSENKLLEKLDLKVFKLLQGEDPTELLQTWLSTGGP